MARFYADEQFPLPVVEFLRALGHDVLTVREAGNAEQGIPDDEVLAFAIGQERSILTINKYDFVRLHRRNDNHYGIVVCSDDRKNRIIEIRVLKVTQNTQIMSGSISFPQRQTYG